MARRCPCGFIAESRGRSKKINTSNIVALEAIFPQIQVTVRLHFSGKPCSIECDYKQVRDVRASLTLALPSTVQISKCRFSVFSNLIKQKAPLVHLISVRYNTRDPDSCERRKTGVNLLVKRARKHDKSAFVQLMEQEGKSMYKVAKAILKNDEDVADAMQETVLTCWEKIDTLKKEKYFRTWLTRILINHCNAIYRQRAKTSSEDAAVERVFLESGFADVEWENFLNCLEEKYRTVIILYYVQGFKSREIAQILQINENTVRGRLSAARKKLEEQYMGDGGRRRQSECEKKQTFYTAGRRVSYEK